MGGGVVGEGKFAHLLKCIVVDNPQEIERGRARCRRLMGGCCGGHRRLTATGSRG